MINMIFHNCFIFIFYYCFICIFYLYIFYSQGEQMIQSRDKCCGTCQPVGCVVNGTVYRVTTFSLQS